MNIFGRLALNIDKKMLRQRSKRWSSRNRVVTEIIETAILWVLKAV